ncbi:glycosyltransferase family 39 protein [Amycolatopsis sp. FDAARGOS 1241]|uniref:glycosyltransferase family 39 protein n=1 Tax=Amycolatopsis sp. FDAARGOS 1241 TaxID=2778070 RepID=UPI001EF1E807|nr:glycosyltransferase family 39 protein [Amycolatopsis sp. FDAARGOS 1241]
MRGLPWAQSGYVRAAGLFLAVRLFSVGVLALMAVHSNRPLLDRLRSWDGWWYLQIAEHNYTGVSHPMDISGHPFPDAPYGFFPLYPAFTELVGQLPGISLTAAGLIVSTVAGIAAACGLYRIGRLVSGPRVGLLLAVLWAGAPMAITESMVMTESLFTALAVWALVGVLERKWFLATGATVFAGLTRSTASVLIAVVVVAAVIDAWRGRRRWQALACVVVAPLGLLGYWGMVAVRTGSVTGWGGC